MEGDNFVLPGKSRVPSVFAAGCLYFCAVAGKYLTGYIQTGLNRLLSYFLFNVDSASLSYAAMIIYYLLFVLLPFGIYAARTPGIGRLIRVKPLSGRLFALVALLSAVGYYFLLCLSALWAMLMEALGGRLVARSAPVLAGAGGALIMTLSTVVMPAISEEMLFRGCMLSAWEEKGSKRAIIITAVFFTLIHSSVSGMPVEFVSGLILAYVVVSTDSLFAGITYHTVHNSIALIMNLLRGDATRQTVYTGMYDSIGGLSGLTVLVVGAALTGFIVLVILKTIKKLTQSGGSFGLSPVRGAEKGAAEYIVIICGIVTALTLYAEDVLLTARLIQ